MTGSLLAHQGGWDEILLVAGPLLLIAGLLWLANRRARAFAEQTEVDEAGGASWEGDDADASAGSGPDTERDRAHLDAPRD